MKRYYTFGTDHYDDDIPLFHEYVVVSTNIQHIDCRTVFLEWRGSNKFAFEYDENEWPSVYEKYYKDKKPYMEITLEVHDDEAD